jgi:hypothetical protein
MFYIFYNENLVSCKIPGSKRYNMLINEAVAGSAALAAAFKPPSVTHAESDRQLALPLSGGTS